MVAMRRFRLSFEDTFSDRFRERRFDFAVLEDPDRSEGCWVPNSGTNCKGMPRVPQVQAVADAAQRRRTGPALAGEGRNAGPAGRAFGESADQCWTH